MLDPLNNVLDAARQINLQSGERLKIYLGVAAILAGYSYYLFVDVVIPLMSVWHYTHAFYFATSIIVTNFCRLS